MVQFLLTQTTYWGGHDEVYAHEQPDNTDRQYCVAIVGLDHYMWHDDHCSNKRAFVCETTSHPGTNYVIQTRLKHLSFVLVWSLPTPSILYTMIIKQHSIHIKLAYKLTKYSYSQKMLIDCSCTYDECAYISLFLFSTI